MSIYLILQYPTFKLFGFLQFSSNLKVQPFIPWLIGEVRKASPIGVMALVSYKSRRTRITKSPDTPSEGLGMLGLLGLAGFKPYD